jgi:hypothetical protein
MPDALKVVLALLPAVGLFFVIRTMVGRRIAQAVALAKAEAAAARAGVEERLRGREEQVAELRGEGAAGVGARGGELGTAGAGRWLR